MHAAHVMHACMHACMRHRKQVANEALFIEQHSQTESNTNTYQHSYNRNVSNSDHVMNRVLQTGGNSKSLYLCSQDQLKITLLRSIKPTRMNMDSMGEEALIRTSLSSCHNSSLPHSAAMHTAGSRAL